MKSSNCEVNFFICFRVIERYSFIYLYIFLPCSVKSVSSFVKNLLIFILEFQLTMVYKILFLNCICVIIITENMEECVVYHLLIIF